MRYLPIIRTDNRSFENAKYFTLAEAMESLDRFIEAFAEARDDRIVEAYVLNIKTGKKIYR